MKASRISLLCLLSAAPSLTQCAPRRPPFAASADSQCAARADGDGRLASVSVQDARIAYRRCGSGSPAIVLEGGFGGNLASWDIVFPKLAAFAPVFAYSRPGFGTSGAAWRGDDDRIRTSEEAARLLRDTLHVAGVEPPYVLVGYSLGGLYVQKFAQLFPRDVAAIVLLDNRPAVYLAECRAAGIEQCRETPPSPDWSPVLLSTFLSIAPSEKVAPTPEQLGGIPVTVVTAGGESVPDAPLFMAGFRKAQADFAARLRNGRHVVIANAVHDSLGGKDSDAAVAEIRRAWEKAARRRR